MWLIVGLASIAGAATPEVLAQVDYILWPVDHVTSDIACTGSAKGMKCTANAGDAAGSIWVAMAPAIQRIDGGYSFDGSYTVQASFEVKSGIATGVAFGHEGSRWSGVLVSSNPVSDGQVAAASWDGQQWQPAIDWRPFLVTGKGEHVVRAEVDGATVRVSIDGQHVGDYVSRIPLDGRVAPIQMGRGKATFLSLRVERAGAAPVVSPGPATAPRPTAATPAPAPPSWEDLGSPFGGREVWDFVVDGPEIYALAGELLGGPGSGAVYASRDGGTTWELRAYGLPYEDSTLCGHGSFAAEGDRLVLHQYLSKRSLVSVDGGATFTWEEMPACEFVEGRSTWTGGARTQTTADERSATLAWTTVDGTPHPPVTVPIDEDVTFAGLDGDSVLWLGDVSTVRTSIDEGRTWTSKGLPLGPDGYVAAGVVGEGVVLVAVRDGRGTTSVRRLRTAPEATSSVASAAWVDLGAPFGAASGLGPFAVDGDKVYALVGQGSSGALWASSDRGATWATVATDLPWEETEYFRIGALSAAGENLELRTLDGAVASADGGKTWAPSASTRTPPPDGTRRWSAEVLTRGAGSGAVGVSRVEVSTDGGAQWRVLRPDLASLRFAAASPTAIYLGDADRVVRTTDGASFEILPLPERAGTYVVAGEVVGGRLLVATTEGTPGSEIVHLWAVE